MKCAYCGSNDYKEIDGYYICQYCGSKVKLKKDHFSKTLLFLALLSIALFIFYPKKEVKVLNHTIQSQIAVNQPPKYVEKNSKNSIKINNTNSHIGKQTITLDNHPIDLAIDNSNANIGVQNIKKIDLKEHLRIQKTIKKMKQMDEIFNLKDKDKIYKEYNNRHKGKLTSFSQVIIDKNGKVLEKFSHTYEKTKENKSHVKVTSKHAIYKIDNENRKFKSQKTFYSQEAGRKFFSVDTNY